MECHLHGYCCATCGQPTRMTEHCPSQHNWAYQQLLDHVASFNLYKPSDTYTATTTPHQDVERIHTQHDQDTTPGFHNTTSVTTTHTTATPTPCCRKRWEQQKPTQQRQHQTHNTITTTTTTAAVDDRRQRQGYDSENQNGQSPKHARRK